MSNLNNNTTQLEALLAKVNALPEAGSTDDLNATITELETKVLMLNTALDGKAAGGSGGESLDNCTIVFHCDYNYWGCNGTFIEDGQHKIIWKELVHGLYELPCTLQAQCGSILYISIPGFYSASITAGELIYAQSGVGIAFKVPDTPTQCVIHAITE